MNEDNSRKYWYEYYSDEGILSSNDFQKNVGRTRNGISIDQSTWNKTLKYICELIAVKEDLTVLDLCCGNGLISSALADSCEKVVGVDNSTLLIEQFRARNGGPNVEIICDDILEFNPNQKFDAIIMYFSIQHFSERQTFLLIEKYLKYLNPKGTFFIGDIPDMDKKWNYINQKDYHLDYFKRLKDDTPKIGNWFKKGFFEAMSSVFDGYDFMTLNQPTFQINSDYRFDLLIVKKQ